jgi:hypothetical protein
MSERMTCIACGHDYDAENIEKDGRCTICDHYDLGVWIKDCVPIIPGWRKAYSCKTGFTFVFVGHHDIHTKAKWMDDIDYWWSVPETLPPPPVKDE